ncbi:MAG TPA: DUF1080 domain-containing protein [Cyclobacteriaceae bacterium]|nr:DUF1080 domain-containing protein [Cyclobacteriaceae bacterium]
MKRFFAVITLLLTGLGVVAQQMKPEETEVWEPVPPAITPGTETAAPSDAIILFDGKNFDHWASVNGGPAKWELKDGAMTVVKGTGVIQTKESFGDCQLHIEWRTPSVVSGESQGRGNSGIFLQSRYEVQVLDNYNNRTYSNGQAGSIYKQAIPMVNACLPPGQWQTYDIIYTAPRFADNSSLIVPAYITVIHNGVIILNHFQIKGSTDYIGLPKYEKHGAAPIQLQDHGNPVSYRNIWIRKI